MELQALWDKARRQTEILRMRLQDLATFDTTTVPYLFLAESSVNPGDTVVRQGHVLVERPAIILPTLAAQFEGFEFDDALATFLLLRGVQFPALKYRHQLSSLDLREDSLARSIEHFTTRLAAAEDVHTGLIVGPEDAWQCSVLLLVGALVIRSAQGDLRRMLEQWRKREREAGGS